VSGGLHGLGLRSGGIDSFKTAPAQLLDVTREERGHLITDAPVVGKPQPITGYRKLFATKPFGCPLQVAFPIRRT